MVWVEVKVGRGLACGVVHVCVFVVRWMCVGGLPYPETRRAYIYTCIHSTFSMKPSTRSSSSRCVLLTGPVPPSRMRSISSCVF